MKSVIEYTPVIAIGFVIVGILGYSIALGLAAFGQKYTALRAWFMSCPAQNIGIPCSAMAAFAIVAVLLKAFPTSKDGGNALMLKAFGLEFSGPSGPITLWLLCFFGFVIALKILRDDQSK